MSYVGDFQSPTGIAWSGGSGNVRTGQVQYGSTDDKLIVVFYKHKVHNAHRSEMEGRPCYDDKDFVRIMHPGESQNIWERPVTDSDKVRFAARWQQYKMNEPQSVEGTSIDLLFPTKPAIAEHCKNANVYTIEQLANISQSGMDGLGMGAQEYVNVAKRYLDSAKDGAAFHKMQKQLHDAEARMRIQEEQIKSLIDQMNALNSGQVRAVNVPKAPIAPPNFDQQTHQINAMDAPKRGPGRPRKSIG